MHALVLCGVLGCGTAVDRPVCCRQELLRRQELERVDREQERIAAREKRARQQREQEAKKRKQKIQENRERRAKWQVRTLVGGWCGGCENWVLRQTVPHVLCCTVN